MREIRAIMKKEFIEILRDKRNLYMILISPFILLIIFGYVVSLDLRKVETAYFCEKETKYVREFISSLTSFGFFISKGFFERGKIFEEIKKGNLKMGIIFGKENKEILFLIDGSYGLSSSVIIGYLSKYFQSRKGNSFEIKVIYLFNPSLKTKNYTVPGVFAVLILILTSILTAISFGIEKERKTIETFMISPVKSYKIIIGKISPYGIIVFNIGIFLILLSKLIFKIPFKGNIFLLLILFLFYIIAGLGIGMLVSLISKSQREAMLQTFLIIFPFILLSGIFFPVESMSEFFRILTNYFNPVTHFLICVRSILLKGANFKEIYPSFLFLIIFSFSIFSISYFIISKEFRRK